MARGGVGFRLPLSPSRVDRKGDTDRTVVLTLSLEEHLFRCQVRESGRSWRMEEEEGEKGKHNA